jgi:hypothetical protein
MHTNEPRQDPLVDMGYETRDVDLKRLGRTAFWFYVFVIGSVVIGALSLLVLAPGYWVDKPTDQLARVIPAEPNPPLQTNVTAKKDMATLRTEEAQRLEGTGYANAERTRVHIPIERAMDLLVERGLPKTDANVAAVSRGNTTDQRTP